MSIIIEELQNLHRDEIKIFFTELFKSMTSLQLREIEYALSEENGGEGIAYNEGYDEGYDEGYKAAEENSDFSYEDGFDSGRDEGYEEGRDYREREQKEESYKAGYLDGMKEAKRLYL